MPTTNYTITVWSDDPVVTGKLDRTCGIGTPASVKRLPSTVLVMLSEAIKEELAVREHVRFIVNDHYDTYPPKGGR